MQYFSNLEIKSKKYEQFFFISKFPFNPSVQEETIDCLQTYYIRIQVW
jgi:hypothetical protein